MLTASADVNVVREFSQLGIGSYLLKPVSRRQLDDHIAAALRRAEAAGKRTEEGAKVIPV